MIPVPCFSYSLFFFMKNKLSRDGQTLFITSDLGFYFIEFWARNDETKPGSGSGFNKIRVPIERVRIREHLH